MTWQYVRPTNDEIRTAMLTIDGHTFDSQCPICSINSHVIVHQLLDEIDLLKAEVERYQNPIVTIDLRPAHSRHPNHFCMTCSDGSRPGAGCFRCRNTGMDQSPCSTCSEQAAR